MFYLHGGAVALVCIGEPAVSRRTLVQVDVLNVDVDADHTSDAQRQETGVCEETERSVDSFELSFLFSFFFFPPESSTFPLQKPERPFMLIYFSKCQILYNKCLSNMPEERSPGTTQNQNREVKHKHRLMLL